MDALTTVMAQAAAADPPRLSGTDLLVIGIVIVATGIVARVIRPAARSILTWLARRSVSGRGARWRVRTPRVFGETAEQAELRRRQRIAATAAGISRVLTTILWIGVILFILERLDIDPVFAISAAGFLGVALSVGGQHSVNDFLTGMHILVEDRFGEGDRLLLKINDEEVHARVANLGAFATRLEGPNATYHFPNREMTTVVNLSQRGAVTELEFEPSGQIPAVGTKAAVEAAVRSRYESATGFDSIRDGLIIDQIDESDETFTVRVRTARPLTDAQRDTVARGQD